MQLPDNERTAWLSRYIDGELSTAEKNAVADRLRRDESWRAELESLQQTDTTVRAVAVKYQQDDGFSKVVARTISDNDLPKEPPPRTTTPKPAVLASAAETGRRRFEPFLAPAIIAFLCVCGWVAWRYLGEPTRSALLLNRGGPNSCITVTQELQAIQWRDGTFILARRGSSISDLDDRMLNFTGTAIFRVARGPRTFRILTGEGDYIESDSGCFELRTIGTGQQVRVGEGAVCLLKAGSGSDTSVVAGAGQEVLPNRGIKAFDPRELNVQWRLGPGKTGDSGDLVPPWPQAGGDANRSNGTPALGPSNLISERENVVAFPLGATTEFGAVVGLNDRAYVLAQAGERCSLIELPLRGGTAAWRIIETRDGAAQCPPVVTQRGRIVTLLRGGALSAYDPDGASVLWRRGNLGDIRALSMTLGGNLVLRKADGIFVIDSETGEDALVSDPAQANLPGRDIDAKSGAPNLKTPGGYRADGSRIFQGLRTEAVSAPTQDPVVALVEDGRGDVFAGYRHGVLHIRGRAPNEAPAQRKEMDFVPVSARGGEMVPHGLAIVSGKLIVTMTRGVQIFE